MSGRILAPYKRPPTPNRVALAVSPIHMLTEQGNRVQLRTRKGLTVYARPADIEAWWERGEGWRYTKDSRVILWLSDSNVTVRPLPDDPEGGTNGTPQAIRSRGPAQVRSRGTRERTDPDAGREGHGGDGEDGVLPRGVEVPAGEDEALAGTLDALRTWAEWLRSHGASPSSMGQSAMSLYKATATHPRLIPHRGKGGASGPGLYVLGGRIGDRCRQGSYEGPLVQYDVQAAYARELARITYGPQWAELRGPALRHLPVMWAEGCGIFAHATVWVPRGFRNGGPLPRRPRRELSVWDHMWRSIREEVYPTGVTLRGVWTYDELAQAEYAGAGIRVDRAWLMPREDSPGPFEAWWKVIQEGRALPEFAGTLAKVTGNCMWGQLIIRPGDVIRRKVVDREVVMEPVRSTAYVPRYVHIAELVTGRVRAEMDWALRQLGDAAMSWHTDGIWTFTGRGFRNQVDSTVGLNTRVGPSPSAWPSRDAEEGSDLMGRRAPDSASGDGGPTLSTLPAPWRRKKVAMNMDYLYPDTFAWSDGERTRYTVSGITRANQVQDFEDLWVTLVKDEPRRTGTGNLTVPRLRTTV